MNDNLIQAAVALIFALILAFFLGRLYRPKPGGLSESDTREILIIIGFASLLFLVAVDRMVPDWLIGIVSTMIGYYFGTRKTDQKPELAHPKTIAELPAVLPAAPAVEKHSETQSASSGSALWQMLSLVAAFGVIVFASVTQSGCATVQKFDDELAEKYAGKTGVAMLQKFRVAEGESQGLIPTAGAVTNTILRDEDTGEIISAHVRAYQVLTFPGAEYNARAAALPTGFEISNLKSQIPNVPAQTAQSTYVADHPPHAMPSATGGGTALAQEVSDQKSAVSLIADLRSLTSSMIEARTYRANIAVSKAAGTLAPQVANGAASAEILIVGALGWTTGSSAVVISGQIDSVTNVALEVPLSKLKFSNYPAQARNGTVVASAASGGDVQFDVLADIAGGTINASIVPTTGSFAGGMFQSLELSGTATLVSIAVTTNAAAAERPTSQVQGPTSGPVLHSVREAGDKRIRWDVSGIESWPVENNIKGWIVVNDVNVEMFRPGSTSQSLKNAFGVGGNHNVRVMKGEKCRIQLKSLKGKKTNAVELVWPFADTQP